MTTARKRLLIALAISLLLNMFLAGFIVARMSLEPPPAPVVAAAQPTPKGPNLRETGRRNRPWRRLLKPSREDLRARRVQIHAARRAVSEALVAEPFDKAALAAALQRLRNATGDAQAALHDALLEAAPDMTGEQRTQLSRAHRLWRAPPGRRPHRRHLR